MTDDARPDAASGLVAAVRGLGTTLLVLSLGLVLGAFLVPQPTSSAYRALTPSAPVRLVVPGLDIKAPVTPIDVSADRVLDPPQDPLLVGWWQASAPPGATVGQTVITGHTVHTGGGALDAVDRAQPGGRIDVVTQEGRMRYRVTRVERIPKAEVAARAQALFGQDRQDGRLVLVSCDDWDGREYASNVVVFAEPLGEPVPRSERALEGAAALER